LPEMGELSPLVVMVGMTVNRCRRNVALVIELVDFMSRTPMTRPPPPVRRAVFVKVDTTTEPAVTELARRSPAVYGVVSPGRAMVAAAATITCWLPIVHKRPLLCCKKL